VGLDKGQSEQKIRAARQLAIWEEAMHEPVKGNLEGYLRGGSWPAGTEEHLSHCEECRKEVDAMRAQTALFRALKPSAEIEPAAGFYARVMNRIETQARPSPWSLFGESLFAKRLVYASATFLVLLGTVFVSSTQTGEDAVAGGPEVVLAGHYAPEPVSMDDPQKDREVILVNLATYEQDYQ
jgi:anti-sigma factor RsiW